MWDDGSDWLNYVSVEGLDPMSERGSIEVNMV